MKKMIRNMILVGIGVAVGAFIFFNRYSIAHKLGLSERDTTTPEFAEEGPLGSEFGVW